MNIVAEVGRLTSDVELKQTPSGVPVCTFTIAVYRTKDATDFLPCVAWRESAEFVSRYFRKGQMIAVTGELRSRRYEDKNKNKRTAIEIEVRSTSFCESAKQKAEEPAESLSAGTPEPHFEDISSDEDLPF